MRSIFCCFPNRTSKLQDDLHSLITENSVEIITRFDSPEKSRIEDHPVDLHVDCDQYSILYNDPYLNISSSAGSSPGQILLSYTPSEPTDLEEVKTIFMTKCQLKVHPIAWDGTQATQMIQGVRTLGNELKGELIMMLDGIEHRVHFTVRLGSC